MEAFVNPSVAFRAGMVIENPLYRLDEDEDLVTNKILTTGIGVGSDQLSLDFGLRYLVNTYDYSSDYEWNLRNFSVLFGGTVYFDLN